MHAAILVLGAALLVAYANGANDNFKGVATLYGSDTLTYRSALAWGTVSTLGGSVAAIFLARGLIMRFSGKGLVPDAIVGAPDFLVAVGLGAALTVFLATRIGFPISTTHALTGALVGAGAAYAGPDVNWSVLGSAFLIPLIIGPFAALGLALALYPALRYAREALGVRETTCLCVGGGAECIPVPESGRDVAPGSTIRLNAAQVAAFPVEVSVGDEAVCVARYDGRVWGLSAQRVLDSLHVLSAGAVGFARGLNDAPKIAGLLVAARAIGMDTGLALIAIAMALGGVLHARRVARTMGHGITRMNAGQGFTANAVTAMLVGSASLLGLPMSTTHVSCGALFGIGAANGRARWRTISHIGLAWIVTLPVATGLAAAFAFALRLAR